MNAQQRLPKVDQSSIKVSQASMISILILAFIINFWPLVVVVAVLNTLGVLSPKLDLYRHLYADVLKPLGVVKSNVIPDRHEPHRFAKGVGAVLAAVASLFLGLGSATVGWVLVWVLILLAGLNLFVGFCLGCFFYYQFNRLGVPGFKYSPLDAE
jgi:uncharacterized RDD family membrane protein YckC